MVGYELKYVHLVSLLGVFTEDYRIDTAVTYLPVAVLRELHYADLRPVNVLYAGLVYILSGKLHDIGLSEFLIKSLSISRCRRWFTLQDFSCDRSFFCRRRLFFHGRFDRWSLLFYSRFRRRLFFWRLCGRLRFCGRLGFSGRRWLFYLWFGRGRYLFFWRLRGRLRFSRRFGFSQRRWFFYRWFGHRRFFFFRRL